MESPGGWECVCVLVDLLILQILPVPGSGSEAWGTQRHGETGLHWLPRAICLCISLPNAVLSDALRELESSFGVITFTTETNNCYKLELFLFPPESQLLNVY